MCWHLEAVVGTKKQYQRPVGRVAVRSCWQRVARVEGWQVVRRSLQAAKGTERVVAVVAQSLGSTITKLSGSTTIEENSLQLVFVNPDEATRLDLQVTVPFWKL